MNSSRSNARPVRHPIRPSERDPLDPASWDEAEVAGALDPRRIRQDEAAASKTGPGPMLVGSTGPFATLAGRYALEAGGSATDAVLTTAFTQVALCLGSWVSYAGLLGLVHHDAACGHTATVSAGYAPFAEERDPSTIPAAPQPSGRTALVPGFVAGAHHAHDQFGRLAWAQLWSPTRYLLERGIPVNTHLERLLEVRAPQLLRTAEGRALFAPEGSIPRAGELARQPALAATVDAIAELGPDWMYHGPWAEHFVMAVRRDGGHARDEDLAGYRPLTNSPLVGSFAGHEIATLPAPDSGGADLLISLARLDAANAAEPVDDPAALDALLNALDGVHAEGSHSDYVVAVDAAGNTAALCHSINTAMWGTSGIVVDGVPVPDPAAFQQPALTLLRPGDHLPMPVELGIAFRTGRPVLGFSSIGAGLHPATVLGLHRVLGLGQSLDEAVAAPLVHAHDIALGDSVTSVLTSRQSDTINRVVDDRFPAATITAARNSGHRIGLRPADDPQLPRGFWAAISTVSEQSRTAARTPYGQGPIRAVVGRRSPTPPVAR